MEHKVTKFGLLWTCPTKGCDVRCWNGQTSTPANQQLRTYRHNLHKLFDPLWNDPKGIFSTRTKAYTWLAKKMFLDQRDTHFGMFSIQQCREAEVHIRKLTNETSKNPRTMDSTA